MKKEKNIKLKTGQKAAEKAGLVIGLVAIGKALVGLFTGSVILLSDALHSASDLISVATSWISLKIAQRPPTKKFPYGYYKVENLAALVVAVLILLAGIKFLEEGVVRLSQPPKLQFPYLAMTMALVGMVTDIAIANFLNKVAKTINSSSLLAASKEKKADIFVSLTVLIGLLSAVFNIPYVEGTVTIFISLLLLKIALETGKDSLFVLMDISPNEELINSVAEVINQVPGVEECLDLKLRHSGPFIFGEATIGIRRKIDICLAHQITEKVEEMVKKKFPQIDRLTVHTEPFISEYIHLAIPVKEKGNLKTATEERFGRAKYILFVNLFRKKIKGFYFIKNPYLKRKVRVGLGLAKLVAQQKSDILITQNIGEIAFHVLRNNLVDIYKMRGKTAQEVIQNFVDKKLIPLSKPTTVKG